MSSVVTFLGNNAATLAVVFAVLFVFGVLWSLVRRARRRSRGPRRR